MIKLIVGSKERSFNSLYFSGGEPHVELSDETIRALSDKCNKHILIDARIGNMNDFGTLLALTYAVNVYRRTEVDLLIPYFPGARQDRQQKGFAYTARIYADIINFQDYNAVYVLDPHSPVVERLVHRCEVIPHAEVVKEYLKGKNIVGLICPDAGAVDRTTKLAEELGMEWVVHARKTRDSQTGLLTGFTVDPLPVDGEYLVVDDICDGGGTFIGLAETLFKQDRDARCVALHLWVTHGIFSKGLDDLFKYYTTIGSTDSFPQSKVPIYENHQVFKLKGEPV